MLFLTILSFLIFLAVSCVVTSENPLSDPAPSEPETGLTGVWIGGDEESKGTGYLVIAYDDDAKSHYIYVYDKQWHISDDSVFEAAVTGIGSDKFLSVRNVNFKTGERGGYYILYMREESPDEIRLFMLDTDFFKKAVGDGLLKGKLPDAAASTSSEIKLMASQEELRAFFKKTPLDKMVDYDDPMVLRRVNFKE